MMTYKRQRAVIINDEKLDRKIDILCKRENRTFSNMATTLLIREIEKQEIEEEEKE